MSALQSELRAVLAVADKNGRLLGRYPMVAGALLLIPLYQLVLPGLLLGVTFLVGGHAVGLTRTAGTGDLVGFLFLGGFIVSVIYGMFWGTAWDIRREMETGTLESLWLAHSRVETLVIGQALSTMLMSAVSGCLLLLLGVFLFGARYWTVVALLLPVLLVLTIAMVGVAYLVTAAVLVLRDFNFVIDVSSLGMLVFSGVLFPISVLPAPLQIVSLLLPTTYALDILRSSALGTPPLLGGILVWPVMVATSLLFFLAGRLLFLRAERRLRVRGALSLH